MEWSKPKSKLEYAVKDINYLGKVNPVSPKWRALRNNTLTKKDYACRYCGGKYSKYLICIHLDCDPENNISSNLDVCCRMCYIITHINYGFLDKVILCWSSIEQKDIVRKTINYVISKKTMPSIQDIDPNAKKSPLSLMELCSILKTKSKLKDNLQNIKVFFTSRVNINFVNCYINSKRPPRSHMYISSESDSDEPPCDLDDNLKDHKLDKTTDNSLKDYFGVTSITDIDNMMKLILQDTKSLLKQKKSVSVEDIHMLSPPR